MDSELYDYRKYDQVWKRVNPQENPYPEARSAGSPPPAAAPAPHAAPGVYQALLREELRHMQEVLHMLENALA